MLTTNTEDVFGELHFPYKILKKVKISELVQITKSRDIFEYIWPVYEPFVYEKEVSYVIFLNRANRILGRWKAAEGSLDGTVLGIDMAIARALLVQARALVFVHNHPSGNKNPSDADKKVTEKLKKASTLLQIKMLDSLIITPDGNYFSFADGGIF